VNRTELLAWRRQRGGPVVFTNGVFDLLHPGHVEILEAARGLGDALVVGVNSDASAGRLGKGPGRPVQAAEARARVVAALAAVDRVVLFDEDTPLSLIESLAPDVLVKGGDYTRESIVGADFVESRGGATVYRFTPTSVRRALDTGWTAIELHEFLGTVSRTPVPQPLSYLVDDTARTFGSIRVGHAEAFVRADDEAALTELLHHPKAASLGLRRLAPTVLISSTPIDVLLPRLRELGVAPVVESPDGTVHVARPDLHRLLDLGRQGAQRVQAGSWVERGAGWPVCLITQVTSATSR